MIKTDFFDVIDTEEKAYWLGFFTADGGLWSNGKQLSIQLSTKDKSHLTKFADIFDLKVKDFIYFDKRTNKDYYSSRVILSSKYMFQKLESIGIGKNKSINLDAKIFDFVPDNMLRHFVRGFFDGDGYVGKRIDNRNNKWISYSITFASTEIFLEKLRNVICSKLNLRKLKIIKGKSVCNLSVNSIHSLNKVRNWFYDSATIYLDRKKEIFDNMPRQRGTSKYIGVSWSSRFNMWTSCITIPYEGRFKNKYLGKFQNEEDAALAYNKASIEYYKDNANLNLLPTGSN